MEHSVNVCDLDIICKELLGFTRKAGSIVCVDQFPIRLVGARSFETTPIIEAIKLNPTNLRDA